ncbi:MAG: undecaprenyl-phosphate glucose phosphotransferase [Anaerolineae bacterium]|nr:undecaprenyl-phosphate glucose phosphotransferase [Anaerolineae bacterium]MDW8067825.1 undecaprenyl-phosphate glucose phosphotransferase [Anaerolineae bacterium]
MKKRRAQVFFIGTLVLTDALMAGAAFYSAYWLRALVPFPTSAITLAAPSAYAPIMLAHVAAVLTALAFNRLYVLARSPSRVDEFYQTIGAATTGTITGIALAYFLYKNTPMEVDYPRAMMVYAWFLTIVLVTVGRLAHGRLRAALQARGWGRDRVLVVGTGDVARMILQKILGNPSLGYQVVGAVEVEGYPTVALPAPILGHARDLGTLIEEHQIDEVIIALPEATHQEILTLISECERGRVTIKVFPDLFQIIAGPMGIGDLGGLPLLTVREVALRGWRRAAKRLMDIVGATVGLILLSPLMLLTAILIKLDSPGPAFYVQERMGLDARPFPMLKFRSMRQDAEAQGPGWTRPGDPRVTRLGSILRRLNVDELPQLINVLLGEMSLVGPRPERPVYVAQFRRSIPRYMERHREKAGMTGWAQVNGLRGDTSIAERTKYDLWYIENWSLLLDLKILLRTLVNIFRSPNAY